MKLSEAIMLNGMTKPQGCGPTSVYSVDSPCAIGGALQAIGKQITGDNWSDNYGIFECEWPWTALPAIHPVSGMPTLGSYAIWHLNDVHHWTRQQIAEWVASIEPAEVLEPEINEEVLCTTKK